MKRVMLFLGIFLWVIGLTACTVQETPPTETIETTAEATTSETETQPNAALMRDNILIAATDVMGDSIHPFFSNAGASLWAEEMIFEGLLESDADGRLKPMLAETYRISEDGLTYTFYLNPEIRFQDGTPLTAQDVVFTYTALADPNYEGSLRAFADALSGVTAYRSGETETLSGVTAVNEWTVQFVFDTADITRLDGFVLGILPAHVYAYKNWTNFEAGGISPVGTGPMVFESQDEDHIYLKANADYHGGSVQIAGVTLSRMKADAALAEYSQGTVDVACVSGDEATALARPVYAFGELYTIPGKSVVGIGFNFANPIFQDEKTRRALSYAIDDKAFARAQWGNESAATSVLIGSDHWAYTAESAALAPVFSMEEAQVLLDEAGWTEVDENGIRGRDGLPLEIKLYTFSDVGWAYNLGRYAVDQWRQLGADASLVIVDYETLLQTVFTDRSADAWCIGLEGGALLNPGSFFKTEGLYNAGGYSNPDMDDALGSLAGTYDTDGVNESAFIEATTDWISIILSDLPYDFIARPLSQCFVNERVQNFSGSAYRDWPLNIKDMTIDYLSEDGE